LATDVNTGNKIVIKKTRLNPEAVSVLATEIRIAKESKHPNLVQLYDVYLVGDFLWVSSSVLMSNSSPFTDLDDNHQISTEFMEWSLTDILEQFDSLQMSEAHISLVCMEVCAILENLSYFTY